MRSEFTTILKSLKGTVTPLLSNQLKLMLRLLCGYLVVVRWV